jgi:Ser/Thr protein kinase RdoA (MazF antagonist)
MVSFQHPRLALGFETVLARLTEESERCFGSPATAIDPLERMDRPFSTVLRVRVRTAHGEVCAFIKRLKVSGRIDADLPRMRRRVQREFNATERIYRVLRAEDGLSVVRPVACFPDELALVTEKAGGETLARFVSQWRPLSAGRRNEELRRTGARIGAWLRAFQRTAPADECLSLDTMRSYLDVRLRQLLDSRRAAITPDDRALALAHFDAVAGRVAIGDLRTVPVHADLCPENVLVDAGRVTVLDFSMAKSGAIFHDLAHLYMHLEFLRTRGRVSGTAIDALEHAMLRAYDPELRPERPLFALMLLQHVACHLAGMAERRPWRFGRLYGWYLRRHRDRCLRLLPLASASD